MLHASYGPAAVRAAVRERLLDSDGAGAQQLRSKLIDWLSAHVPDGLLPRAPPHERREAWLYEYCHDAETYRLSDAALHFALCGMRVLRLRHLRGELPGPPCAATNEAAIADAAAAVGDAAAAHGGRPHPAHPPTPAGIMLNSTWLLIAGLLLLVAACWQAMMPS